MQPEYRPRRPAGPSSPWWWWGGCQGAVAPRWPRTGGARAAFSPRPREGSRVLFILPETFLECLLGNKGSWGAGPWEPAGGASRWRRAATGLCWGSRETSPGGPGGGSGLRGAGGGPEEAGPPPGDWAAQPGGRTPLGQRWGGGSRPPPGQGLVSLPRPLVASLWAAQPSSHVGLAGEWPQGLAQEKVGIRRPCPGGELVPGNLSEVGRSLMPTPPPSLLQTPICCAQLPPRPCATWECPPAWSTHRHLQPTCQALRHPHPPRPTTPSCSGTCT